jgi:hypothetical protein
MTILGRAVGTLVVLASTAAAATVTAPAVAKPSTPSGHRYAGFVVIGGPSWDGKASDAPAWWLRAVSDSARTGKNAFVTSPGHYVLLAAGAARPDNVACCYYLPDGNRYSSYGWQQTTPTQSGVVITETQEIVAEVEIRFRETITGNTSDYWKYAYQLHYVKGGAYNMDADYRCAVNINGHPDQYCKSITYPDGSKDTDVSEGVPITIHDLNDADLDQVDRPMTGFFGLHSTPPPNDTAQVIKYALMDEYTTWPQFDNTIDQTFVRTYDVCVPKRQVFSGVTLCTSSGTGH